jgi:hypothetical protein
MEHFHTRLINLFIYLFIHPFATSRALEQVKQNLKQKGNVPSWTILQDLHTFS